MQAAEPEHRLFRILRRLRSGRTGGSTGARGVPRDTEDCDRFQDSASYQHLMSLSNGHLR